MLNTMVTSSRDTIVGYLRQISKSVDIRHSLCDLMFYLVLSLLSYFVTSSFDSLRPLRLRLQLVTLLVMTIDPAPYFDPKLLLISIHTLWMTYSRVTYVDYLQENHRLMLRVVQESVE